MVDAQVDEAALELVTLGDGDRCVGGIPGRDRGELDLDRSSSVAARNIETGVDREPMDPGVEPIGIAEPGQVPPRPDERVLHRVAGQVLVAEDQASHGLETADRGVEEQGEGVMVASPGSLHELAFAHRIPREASALNAYNPTGAAKRGIIPGEHRRSAAARLPATEGSDVKFDIYVWAAPRDLDADAAGELVEAWEAAGGDPAQSPFEPSTDIGWFRRELGNDLPGIEVSSDAVPTPSRLPIVLAADDEPPARVIAIRLPRDDATAAHDALGEIYSLAVKYDTVVYEPARGVIHEPQRTMAEHASATFWPRGAIRTTVAIVIGLAVAVVAWLVGILLLSGLIALFALFMVGIFVVTLVSEARKAVARRGGSAKP